MYKTYFTTPSDVLKSSKLIPWVHYARECAFLQDYFIRSSLSKISNRIHQLVAVQASTIQKWEMEKAKMKNTKCKNAQNHYMNSSLSKIAHRIHQLVAILAKIGKWKNLKQKMQNAKKNTKSLYEQFIVQYCIPHSSTGCKSRLLGGPLTVLH